MARLNKGVIGAVAFAAGCLCMFLYVAPSRQKAKLSLRVPAEGEAREDDQQFMGWTRPPDTVILHDLNPPPSVKLPPVKDVLPKAAFSSNWTEDSRLENLRQFGFVESIPDINVLNTLTSAQLSVMLHSYLDNVDFRCYRKLRMGLVGDNGWEVCDDIEWRPIRPCIIYSFGINYDFSFDDDAGRIYGCDVYSFDPSMDEQPTYQRSERVMFYRVGIGGQSGDPVITQNGWVLHSFSNFRTMLGHSNKIIDVVKMDVERAEWQSLATMIKERQLHNVRQLLVEFHVHARHVSGLRQHLKLLGDLERLGFRKFYITKNKAGGCTRFVEGFPIKRTKCYEVHYVNVNFSRRMF